MSHLSHANGYVLVIKDISRGINFYIVEIKNVLEKDPTLQMPMPSIYKMMVTVMLRVGLSQLGT